MFRKHQVRSNSSALRLPSRGLIQSKAHFALALIIVGSMGGGRAIAQVEVRKIFDPNGQLGDIYGLSVDLSGDTAVVGAPSSNAVDVDAGAAFIHQQNEGGSDTWGIVRTLLPPPLGAGNDAFGQHVAISGDIVAVGRPGDDYPGESNAGSVSIYYRGEGGPDQWGLIKTIGSAALLDEGDLFGGTLDLSGDILIVGVVRWENSGNSDWNSGTVFVFSRNEGGDDQWGLVTQLFADDPFEEGLFFGAGVTIDGDIAVVGSFFDDGNSPQSGAAYIYSRNEGGENMWGLLKKVFATDGQDDARFGRSVARFGDTLVVGASFNALGPEGAAYVFDRNFPTPDNWGQVAKLQACDGADGFDQFGFRVAVNADHAYVGSYLNDDACPGDPFCFSGNVYIFGRDEGGPDMWGPVTTFVGSDVVELDHFSIDLIVEGARGIIGAINGDGQVTGSGTTYVFECLSTPCPSDLNTDGVVGVADFLILLAT